MDNKYQDIRIINILSHKKLIIREIMIDNIKFDKENIIITFNYLDNLSSNITFPKKNYELIID